ncbi:MAG: penicillin acylase family protein [Metallibacterium sp.]
MSANTANTAPRARWRRRLGWSAAALLALLLLAFTAAWLLLAGSRPRLDGRQTLTGLAAPVQVQRDALGVARISARNRTDLAYALGFVHGQERFFEMDLMRRVAAGELSALIGPAALKVDEANRMYRFRALAQRIVAQLPADQRGLLDAYARGVNAGLAALDVRPWEYLLLRQKPRPWTPADSILVVDAMYLDLITPEFNTPQRARLYATLPKPLVDFLLAPDPRWEAPLQGAASAPVAMPAASVFDLRTAPPVAPISTAALTSALRERAVIGSNSFAVSGKLTASGAAIVANDMHLGLGVPNIWYRAELRYPDPADRAREITLNGVTLPGAPLLVAGTNGHIAWGFTDSYGKWRDWVRVLRDPADPSRYRVPGGWATLREHREVIDVAGAKPVPLIVQDTIWGPIMAHGPHGTPLAMDWIALHTRAVNLNLLHLETATSVQQALAIAPTLGIPPQNFLVGDARGHIGWTLAGNAIPLRQGFDPNLPADFSRPGVGWTGWLAPADYPRIVDPPDGRLWTANNRVIGGAWLALEGDGGFDLGARAQQLRDDLNARPRFTAQDMLDIQLDDRAVFMRHWYRLLRDTLTQNPQQPELHALAAATQAWSGRASTDSVAYHAAHAFREKVIEATLAPFVARVKARYPDFAWPSGDTREYAVWTLVTQRPLYLLDRRYASWNALLADCAQQVAEDFAKAPGGIAAQTWGRRNTTRIDHPLSAALPAPLRWLIDQPRTQLPGDNNMPRVQAPAFGASERFGIMPGHLAESYLHMPGGQSDNPLSPYYDAGWQAWAKGQATPLRPGPAQHTLLLMPAPRGR